MNIEQQIFARTDETVTFKQTLILCLFLGDELPSYCEPMLREPAPPTGQFVRGDFSQIYADALRMNPAVHDGAVMLSLASDETLFKIRGWSYRLFPPPIDTQVTNRGSAFVSSLSMSLVETVLSVFHISAGKLIIFEKGKARLGKLVS